MKNAVCFLLCLTLICIFVPVCAEEVIVYNRTNNLQEEFVFPENSQVLEIVFPRVYSSDCAILRFGSESVMIDASSGSAKMDNRIQTAIASMGLEQIDLAINSHPHGDHIDGFPLVDAYCPIGKMMLALEEDDSHTSAVTSYFRERGIPVERVQDGDVLTLGPEGEVLLRVYQRCENSQWPLNDRSAMLLVQYGQRSILFSGDVENRAQASYASTPPAGGLHADILKYPHHGQVRLNSNFMDEIDPQLVFINGAANVMEGAKTFLEQRGVPFVLGYQGLTRMRTDGNIWVVDYLYEQETDRETINPNYTSTTHVP